MKKVIFICLLTVSVCFSQPTTDIANKTNTAAAAPINPIPKTDNKTAEIKPNEKETNHTVVVTLPPPAVKPGNDTVHPKNDTSGKNDTNVKPAEPPTNSTSMTTIPTITSKVTSTPVTTQKANETTTTQTPKPASPSVAPPTLQARGFDGASFVGGIILTLGLIAVGFMGFRYYKTQTERNYHTL